MKLIKLGILIFSVFLISSCDEFPDHDAFIEIINNSNEDIVWIQLSNVTVNDTLTLTESLPWSNINEKIIPSGTEIKHDFIASNVQKRLSTGWFVYYLFSYDSLMTIPWERIRDEHIVLKQVYFETWEDMEACDFTITYP
ncbi:MAG: hypothetical protein GQ564_18230 [Bacteroidales bacterium]|nr:hypothetical protein [Bacteroidales bacterium]